MLPQNLRDGQALFSRATAMARTSEEKIKCDGYGKKRGEAKSIVESEVTHVVRSWRTAAPTPTRWRRAHP